MSQQQNAKDELQQYLNYSYSNSLYFCYSNLDKYPDPPEIYAQTIQLYMNSPPLQINSVHLQKPVDASVDTVSLQSLSNTCISSLQNIQHLENNEQSQSQFSQYNNRKSETINSERALAKFWTQQMSDRLNILKSQKSITFVEITDVLNQEFNLKLKPNQVQQRWQRVQSPDIKKGRWDENETDTLVKMYQEFKDLKLVQKQMNGRTLLQIKNRLKQLNIQ